MTKVEAIIQAATLEAVRDALHELGVEGMTILEVRGHGQQKGHTGFYRGREYTVDLIPKIKLEIILADSLAERAVNAVATAFRTGKIGDGRSFFRRSTKRSVFGTTNAAKLLSRIQQWNVNRGF